jgi:hypothetical protein
VNRIEQEDDNEEKRKTECGHFLCARTAAVKRIFNIGFHADTALVYTF